MNIKQTLDKLGIENLSPMQQDAYEAIANGDSDVVVLSPTGSGKTLAYLLPLAEQLSPESDKPQAIVVVPGRELAMQSDTVLRNMGTGLRSFSCYGGRTAMDEHRAMKQTRPQVLFGTPGRLNDHIAKGNFDVYGVRWLIIDEFDKCLEMGFHDEMASLLKSLPGVRRRLLLSATNAEEIPSFVRMGKTVTIDYTSGGDQVPQRIELMEVRSEQKDKLDTLGRLLRSFGDESSIVFISYRDSVERTADWLRRQNFAVNAFHGGMDQKQREDALYRFSNGSANIFVSTDLASRGLDIPDVDNIVHYHLPLNEEAYIHRVGRTARWQATGKAWFLLGPDESKPDFIDQTLTPFQLPDELPPPSCPRMTTIYIGKGRKDKISRGDIVGFLCKKGQLTKSEIGRIDVKDRYAYAAIAYNKLRQTLQLTQGEKIKGIRTVVEPVK